MFPEDVYLYETRGDPPSDPDGVHPTLMEVDVVSSTPRVGGAGGTPLFRLTETEEKLFVL